MILIMNRSFETKTISSNKIVILIIIVIIGLSDANPALLLFTTVIIFHQLLSHGFLRVLLRLFSTVYRFITSQSCDHPILMFLPHDFEISIVVAAYLIYLHS